MLDRFRAYADETNQFLKSFVPPPGVLHKVVPDAAVSPTYSPPVDERAGAGASLVGHVAVWNPFEDPKPFCQLTEDHLFGAEFDKIRRGSQSST